MANIKSAKKRIDIAKRNRLRNRSKRSEIKTYIKKFDAALEANSPQEAQELLKVIDRKLKRASLQIAYSKNAASRTVSRLQKRLNVVAAQ
ncbi:30S ribosomal protein S20 [Murdochiella sp. Marseille-P8839]|nr:30S ribosomal protein S20 [Murdochiella sp. Marseille-P8839]